MLPAQVTIQFTRDGRKESRQVKLLLSENVAEAIKKLVSEVRLPVEEEGEAIHYCLYRDRRMLDEYTPLAKSGIKEGDHLELARIDPNMTMGHIVMDGLFNRLRGQASGDPLPVTAWLVASNGKVFELKRTCALLGRADAKLGTTPESLDADLSDLDALRTVSRMHAAIMYESGEFTVRDLRSTHGLFVNGALVFGNKPQPIHNGDTLTLGDVKLEFHC